MQRRELKKAIRKFSHRTNFYKLGLIRKLLKHREEEQKELENNIPKVICPNCGSTSIDVENDDREYSNDSWLHCNNCEHDFDDTFGYEDAIQEIECLCWGYAVDVELHFEEPDIKSLEWQKRCRDLILEELKSS